MIWADYRFRIDNFSFPLWKLINQRVTSLFNLLFLAKKADNEKNLLNSQTIIKTNSVLVMTTGRTVSSHHPNQAQENASG